MNQAALLHKIDWTEVLLTILILAGSWAAARVFVYLLRALGRRWAALSRSTLDDYLFSAIGPSLSRLLFLLGAYLAMHRYKFALLLALDGVIFTLAVVVVTHMAIRVQSALTRWYLEQPSRGPREERASRDLLPLGERVGQVVIVLVGMMVILDHFHIEIRSLLVTLGVGSLAIGLALQDTLANMFGGFVLQIDRPFRVGDRVMLDTGETGDVLEIGIRSTRILKLDRHVVIVPNALLVRNRVTNLSHPDVTSTVSLELRVGHGSDVDRARAIMLEAARRCEPVIQEPPPRIFMKSFDDCGVTLLFTCRTVHFRQQMTVTDQLNTAILAGFQEAGIRIPGSGPTVVVQTGGPASGESPGATSS